MLSNDTKALVRFPDNARGLNERFGIYLLTLVVLAVIACAAAACSEQPRRLSPKEVDLTEALMFVLEGVESNGIQKYRFAPWKRQIVERDVEYVSMGNNSIHSSDEEWNAKTRDSKFIKYTEKISPLDSCAFRKESLMAWSKGDSKEEFTALVEHNHAGLETLYLMNAYRFDITWDADGYPEGEVVLEGPGVVCKDNKCGNEWGLLFHPYDVISSKEIPVSVARRRKALELVKKACPGKPY